jgi:N-acetylated-alpha-linked acidic dipeptidase
VYEQWKIATEKREKERGRDSALGGAPRQPNAIVRNDVNVGDLGSGSDYTAFLQHLGVPSADIGSGGPYGVYHSVFDNFAWFAKFGDPTFEYEQQMARVYGLETLRMASEDVLPFDYEDYGKEIVEYLKAAENKSKETFGAKSPSFTDAQQAASRFEKDGAQMLLVESSLKGNPERANQAIRDTERAFLIDGLPERPWFKHAIYAPGEYTGYAAVVIPGVNEAIDKADLALTQEQLKILTGAINRAAETLEKGM